MHPKQQPAEVIDESENEVFKPSGRLISAVLSLAVVNLACAFDATTIATALPVITTALNGTSIQAFWVGTSFLLASTVWQPSFVSFSHVFGRRPVLLLAMTLFTVGCIVGALAHNMTQMLVGRCLQGSGVGGIMSLTETLITDMVPLRQRGDYIALISIVWAIGTVSGPPLGGLMAQGGAWRWIFYLNLPIVGVGFFCILLFLKLERSEGSFEEQLGNIDYVGSVVFVASTTSLLVAISWGGVMYAWWSWHTLVPLLLGLAGLGLFVLYERRFAKATLMPLVIFKNPTTSITYGITFLHGMILWSLVYYMPLYVMSVLGFSPIRAGILQFPQTLTIVPVASMVGVLTVKTGSYRWAIWSGFVLTTIGCGLLCLFGTKTKVIELVFLLLIAGVGFGLLFPAMNLSIQASVLPIHVGTAAGIFPFFRAFGQSVGVAVGGVIFQNRMRHELHDYPNLAIYGTDAIALVEQMRLEPADSPQNIILKHAFANSTRVIWAAMTGIAAIGLLASCFVKGYKLESAISTKQGFVESANVGDGEKLAVDPGKSGKMDTITESRVV